MTRCLATERQFKGYGRRFVLLLVVGALALAARPVSATSIVPVTARELVARADVIVHGVVVSSHVGEDALGRPETITIITPLEVLKGHVSGALVLHQLGGELPDGRFFKLWGRPEYAAGHEVVVFAIARAEGDHQTAELVLGKFEVQQDERGVSFAVPALVADAPVQVTVMRQRRADGPDSLEAPPPDEALAPRELDGFLRSLRGEGTTPQDWTVPRGALSSSVYPEYLPQGVLRFFINIGGLWRWNNGATAVWTLDGQANVTGGGTAEAANATATWDAQPNSTIDYTIGPGGVNPIHLNALSSPCGWNTCMAGSGVIGCGGPGGSGGSNAWRGETYGTITNGEVWLRAYCTLDLWDSITTQAVLTHELGHTLGLGHSDTGTSPHDVCRGDEDAAQMRSFVQHRTTLGADDEDAVRWLYGDAGNSCTVGGPTLSVTKTGAGTGTVTSIAAGISCGTTCFAAFAAGAVVTLSAAPGANSVFTGWSGDADCADSSVTMNASKTCTAHFDLRPDLLISALTAPSAALAGSTISLSETTKNQGGPAAASVTRYYLSTNTTFEAGDTALGFRLVPALVAGASSAAPGGSQLTIPLNTATGNYYIIARADADGQVPESNESNNTKATAIHIGPPDLIVSSLSVSARSGADLTTTLTVTDITLDQSGTGPAAPTITRFYLSTDATLGAVDVTLGFRNVPALSPGSSSPGSTSMPVPSGTAPGTYYVIAKANADSSTPETNVTNNTLSIKIVIGPDLVLSSLSAPAVGGAGLPVDVTDTTKNQGTGSAAASRTAFYLSANAARGAGDVLLGSRPVGILVPNSSSTITTTLTIPGGTPAGSYYIIAVADDGGAVPETNEANNTRAVLIRLSPDLIVSSMTIFPTTVSLPAAAGSAINVTETTRNQGAGTAVATTTKYYLSTNPTFDALADVWLASRGVPLLATGASSLGPQTMVTIPPGTVAGNYYILAVADADNTVAESNENNNVTARPLTITP
jgi:subtilase family serine protease